VTARPSAASALSAAALPIGFVLLWSTGFIAGKLSLPYAEPMTFLLWRYGIVAALLGGVALAMRASWPKRPTDYAHLAVAGLLMHGVYIGGVFASMNHGLPAGVSALIVALQPLLTAIAAGPLLGERVARKQWFGLLLGLAGVALVVWEKLGAGEGGPLAVALSALALVGMTAGTLYQKRWCTGFDLRSGTAIQYVAAALGFAVLAPLLETMVMNWTFELAFALGWSILVLSVGAVLLLFILLRRGAASRVSALFYLVPPCTAVVGWALFGETLGALALCGMALTVAGVALATRP
jgi:drug/metabolite transporter (DMT)-like permease